jgi:3-oxoadipate enol-lactonase
MAVFEKQGIKFFYEVKGNTSTSEVIIFLNGVMASTSSWASITPVFESHQFSIVLHDFRGQLRSDKPSGPYSFDMHAEDVLDLMNYLDIEKAHFIGTSYGGEVAMRFAINYPKRMKTLCVIGSVSELDEKLIHFVKSWKQVAKSYDGEAFFWTMMPSIYHSDYIKINLDEMKKRALTMNLIPKDYFDGQILLYDTFLEDVTMTNKLHKISCPTLIIAGEDDILKPIKFSMILASKIADSEFVVIPDSAHVTIFEKPKILQTIMLGFLMKHIRIEKENENEE